MASPKGDCLVRDVKLRSGNLGPVLVNFEHGRLKKKDATGLKCRVFSSHDNSKICTVGAVAEGGDVVYQGDVQKDEGDICHNFLAIRNKRTNKMRIYEASNVTLSPSIASSLSSSLDMPGYNDAMYNLNQTFGSKKTKRVAEQRKRMEVNVDNVTTKLSTTINDVEVKTDIKPTVEDDSISKLLPPCNRDVKDPADVYPISGMLTDKELRHLEKFYSKAVEAGTFEQQYKKSPFFKKMEKFISPENHRNAALLLYADCLLNFCNLKMEDISKQSKGPCPYSELIHKKIGKEFTIVAGSFNVHRPTVVDKTVRPQSMVDKAVAYIIILSLHIGKFKFDLNHLIECVRRVDVQRIKMIATIIGSVPANSSQGQGKTVVVLKAPLPPPRSFMFSSKRRRN